MKEEDKTQSETDRPFDRFHKFIRSIVDSVCMHIAFDVSFGMVDDLMRVQRVGARIRALPIFDVADANFFRITV